jgi:hypothetical protein
MGLVLYSYKPLRRSRMNIRAMVAASVVCLLFAAGCAPAGSSVKQQDLDSGIMGQVLIENEGAAPDVFVYAYESGYNDLRVPTKLISEPSAKDGSYALRLAPGSYFIVARKRVSGDPKGYLVKGDYEGKYPGNPVTVRPGEYATVNLSIAMLAGNFLLAPYIPDEGEMGITGKVYGLDGKPAAGAFVLLYKDKEMVGLPAYLSKPTNKDGEFSLYIPQPGTYFVAARIKYGGLPKKGEPYGMYEKDPEHKVTINHKEQISGVDISLSPFPFDLAKPVPSAAQPAP